MKSIEAIYEGGVFTPVVPIVLPEKQRAVVILTTAGDSNGQLNDGNARRGLLDDLVGIVKWPGPLPSDDECDRLLGSALNEKPGL